MIFNALMSHTGERVFPRNKIKTSSSKLPCSPTNFPNMASIKEATFWDLNGTKMWGGKWQKMFPINVSENGLKTHICSVSSVTKCKMDIIYLHLLSELPMLSNLF